MKTSKFLTFYFLTLKISSLCKWYLFKEYLFHVSQFSNCGNWGWTLCWATWCFYSHNFKALSDDLNIFPQKRWNLTFSSWYILPTETWLSKAVNVYEWNSGLSFFLLQFSSVTQSCPTLCNSMDYSMPGFPVHHQLPELTQTHVHWLNDAIQTSYLYNFLLSV